MEPIIIYSENFMIRTAGEYDGQQIKLHHAMDIKRNERYRVEILDKKIVFMGQLSSDGMTIVHL